MALPSYYNTGTASIVASGTIVTGANTFWLGRVWPGDLFGSHLGFGVRIASVDSDTKLTLSHAWPGPPQSGAAYEIQLVPDGVRAQETTRLLLEKMQQGMFVNPDATGTLAERAQYDDAEKGFRFLRTDVSPFLLYVKNDASGAWSPGASFLGPKGDPGSNGVDGIGDAYDIHINALSRPGDGEEFDHLFARTVIFPAAFAAGRATVSTAPTGGAAVFTILKNGASVGTITFANGSKNGVFAGAATVFAAGDKLTVRAPSPRNSTLSGMLFVLAGNR